MIRGKCSGVGDSDMIFGIVQAVNQLLCLFYKIAMADFFVSFNGALLTGLVVSVLIIFVISYGYAGIRRYRPSVQGAFCQGAFRGNLAYIGLAIVYNAFGEEGFAVAGILLGFLVPLFNFLSPFVRLSLIPLPSISSNL
jgi:predicted permease